MGGASYVVLGSRRGERACGGDKGSVGPCLLCPVGPLQMWIRMVT